MKSSPLKKFQIKFSPKKNPNKISFKLQPRVANVYFYSEIMILSLMRQYHAIFQDFRFAKYFYLIRFKFRNKIICCKTVSVLNGF